MSRIAEVSFYVTYYFRPLIPEQIVDNRHDDDDGVS